MSVVQFPESKTPEFLVGPFQEWRVQIDGRIIPRLTGYREGEKVWLVLDGRFGLECADESAAYRTASFVANALAIGEGYSHLGAETKARPFAPLGCQIEPQPPRQS